MDQNRKTIETLLLLLNPLRETIDDQTNDEIAREEMEIPRDREHDVVITHQMVRDLTEAVMIVYACKRDLPPQSEEETPAVQKAKRYFDDKAGEYDAAKKIRAWWSSDGWFCVWSKDNNGEVTVSLDAQEVGHLRYALLP